MKQINLDELWQRIADELNDRKLLITKEAGYSSWFEVDVTSQEFAGALEKVIRDCLTL